MQKPRKPQKSHGHLEAGVTLIVLGSIFLLHQLHLVKIELQWYLFTTAAFATLGLIDILTFKHLAKIIDGLVKIAMGAWFYLSFAGIWGISPANSWPFMVIIAGLGLVFKALLKPSCAPQPPQDSH